MEQVRGQISEIENKLKIRFTDERLRELPYILCLVLIRIKKGRILKIFLNPSAYCRDKRVFCHGGICKEQLMWHGRREKIFLASADSRFSKLSQVPVG